MLSFLLITSYAVVNSRDDVKFPFDNGKLTIYGSGSMADYEDSPTP